MLNLAGYLTENRKCNKVEVELDLVEGGSSPRGFSRAYFCCVLQSVNRRTKIDLLQNSSVIAQVTTSFE